MERRNRKWPWLVIKKSKKKLKGSERKPVGTVTSIRYAWAVDVFSMCRVKAQQGFPRWLCTTACPSYAHEFSIAGSHCINLNMSVHYTDI